MEDKTEKGFTVKDKRIFSSDGESRKTSDETSKDGAEKNSSSHDDSLKKTETEGSPPIPEVSFSSFILSLSSSALFHFGEIPDPVTDKKQRNLPMAKQTIDILGLLKEKTAGNLTKDEHSLFENLLHDLRLRYIEEVKKEKA